MVNIPARTEWCPVVGGFSGDNWLLIVELWMSFLTPQTRMASRSIAGTACLAFWWGLCLSWTAYAAAPVDSPTQKATGFEDGKLAPFHVCTTKNPNSVQVVEPAFKCQDGTHCVKAFWTQEGYDGTRMKRGAEACSDLLFTKEGWYGFSIYLPSKGFPFDKNLGIAQVFCHGGAKTWGAMLDVKDNELWISHRGNAAPKPDHSQKISGPIARDRWIPVIIHFIASRRMSGLFEVWIDDAAQNSPSYRSEHINFGFGSWNEDTLASGIGLKFGMYCFDESKYTPKETRTIYFDCVSQLVGGGDDAWSIVNPAALAK